MKKIVLLLALAVTAFHLCADTYSFSDDDIIYFYWDPGYSSFQSYYEYKADALYEQGEVNDSLWYYRVLSDFYPLYYKGWYGIIRCYSQDFKNFDFINSEKYIEKLEKTMSGSGKDLSAAVLAAFKKQWPQVQESRKKREAEDAKKRTDNFYNMNFVRKNGILEKYNGSDTDVIIPSDVTIIGDAAFRQSSSIERIVFHSGVTEIGKNAFANCSNLREVIIPSTVKRIGDGAFRDCFVLESVEIPGSVEILPPNLFAACKNLKTVTINNGVREIGKAFTGCTSLSTLLIPKTVTKITEFAFSGCSNLKVITILNADVSIGKRAFYGCPLETKETLIQKYGETIFK